MKKNNISKKCFKKYGEGESRNHALARTCSSAPQPGPITASGARCCSIAVSAATARPGVAPQSSMPIWSDGRSECGKMIGA